MILTLDKFLSITIIESVMLMFNFKLFFYSFTNLINCYYQTNYECIKRLKNKLQSYVIQLEDHGYISPLFIEDL